MREARLEVLEFLERQLVGPVEGHDEVLLDPPTGRYGLGAIYPRSVLADEATKDQELDDRGGGAGDTGQEGPPDDPVALASQWMPASVGMSLLVRGTGVTVEVSAATYLAPAKRTEDLARDVDESETSETDADPADSPKSPDDDAPGWRRHAIAERDAPETHLVAAPHGDRLSRKTVLGGRGELVTVWRPVLGGHLVTLTLVNTAPPDPASHRERTLGALFQVHLRCQAGDGERIVDYPRASTVSPDYEDQELELQYLDHRTFAVGHGCSVRWADPDAVGTRWVETAWIPTYETPNLVPRASSLEVLRLQRLAADTDSDDLADALQEFIRDYRRWVGDLNPHVPERLESARDRILARITAMADRMELGADLIRQDSQARRAFQLSNRALTESMRRGEGIATSSRGRNQGHVDGVVDPAMDPSWRPFQLAFQLAVLPSLVEPGHPDRELVDLLWFPTGGGKTEAYLGLAATAMFLRRLEGAGPGPTVLTRYTLRLLTTQQFQRAATLVAACELIRRTEPELGDVPFRLGLWIGSKNTPNTCSKAKEAMLDLLEADQPSSPFNIDVCPWCATRLVPPHRSDDEEDYGFDASVPNDFIVRCPSQDCPLHSRVPVQVVDEVIYRDPPEFIVATVDKFAQLAFKPESASILGVGVAGGGPSLVIQDELHLLSGPLGTIVGLYEAAFQEVLRHVGAAPKIVASTATIRRAQDQARGLFGRDVSVFPPPGLRYGDSYFAQQDADRPGRLYAGVMSQVHTPSFTVVETAAALLQARDEIADLTSEERDAYGTLVAYHNSLRELGKVVTFARDDIPARMEFYATDGAEDSISADDVVELTSNVGDRELTRTLARLNAPADSTDGVRFVACTNMLSVGVDVQRLALMLVNGQPKTSSEYIQATSRVGRGGVPGLVVTTFSAAKPRDRSHYEQFVSYHHSLYRWVEPTSVTPFALPARNRALHAALVILVRHVLGLRGEAEASAFRSDLPGLESIIDRFVDHVSHVDADEADATRNDLWRLVRDWHERATGSGNSLRYRTGSKQFDDLLKNFGASGTGWATPNSMRNVDRECLVNVAGAV